ncbi:MAG: METTL5 family protein [Candidatus Thermoplasmatota archaeon]|nr:METTL5 family protein [Candidatus Thermoplasmatota archaeon]
MIIKRRHLEILLSSLKDVGAPKADLEQYRTPSSIVCDILYEALVRGDVEGRTVMELGCGGAPFAIGASLLDPSKVCGVDIDPASLETARSNVSMAEKKMKRDIEIHFLEADISDPSVELPQVDTIFMNPPFGAQKKHADRPFVERAVASSKTTYSIHNGNSVDFLKKLSTSLDAKMELLFKAKMVLPHMYSFHRKEKEKIGVVIVRYH